MLLNFMPFYCQIIFKSTLRLPDLKVVGCSGLTLSVASLPRLQRRGLAGPNGLTGITLFFGLSFDLEGFFHVS